jgi:hypothetical protein
VVGGMILCPVDVARCTEPACQAGHCIRAETLSFALCWECGTINHCRHALGSCTSCRLIVGLAEPVPEEVK